MKQFELPTNRFRKTEKDIRAIILTPKDYTQGAKLSASFDNVTCRRTAEGYIIDGLIPIVFDKNAVESLKEPSDRIYLCTIPKHTLVVTNGRAGAAKRVQVVSEIALELLPMSISGSDIDAFTDGKITVEPSD